MGDVSHHDMRRGATWISRLPRSERAVVVTLGVLLVVTVVCFRTSSPRGTSIVVVPSPLATSTAPSRRAEAAPPQPPALGGRILLFGDSLTAGGYYDEFDHRLRYRSHPYRKAFLKKLVAAGGLPPRVNSSSYVVAKGFPGRDSRQLLGKLKSLLLSDTAQSPPFSLAVVLSGTNDALGMVASMPQAFDLVVSMHELLHSRGVATIAVKLPPINFNNTLATYGSSLPRGYCKAKTVYGGRIEHRVREFNALLEQHAALSQCLVDATKDLPHPVVAQDDVQLLPLWSDCVHPSPAGYDLMGEAVAAGVALGRVCRRATTPS